MAVSVYVSDLTHTSQTIASNTMPSAVGGLVTYAKSRLKDPTIFEFTLFKYPEKLIAAVLDKTPDIACFSNYAWNLDLSYNVAARIKKRNPGLILIVGGPNYSTDAQEQQRFFGFFSVWRTTILTLMQRNRRGRGVATTFWTVGLLLARSLRESKT